MKDKTHFGMDDIPYDILEEHGLSQQMVDDLPEEVIQKLLSGERTPVLPLIIKGVKGKAKISLVDTEDGIDVMVMPYFSQAKLDEFEEEQRNILLEGHVLLATQDGEETYFQLDDETNQIVSCPKSAILNNVQVLEQQDSIDAETAKSLIEGKASTFSRDGGTLTYEVDLTEETGIKTSKGEVVATEKTEEKLPRFSFGIYGCWVNDEAGNLSYVEEDNYTPEMMEAQERAAASVKHGLSR